MYRILIKNREQNQTKDFKYSYYSEEDTIFQSSDLNAVINQVKELMENYLVPDLTIVKLVETNINIETPELQTIDLKDSIKLVNDGTTFSITIVPTDGALTVIDYNEEMMTEIRKYLKTLGLTSLVVKPGEITAKNPTGAPVEGAIEVQKGLFLFYSRKTQSSDYTSSSFSLVLRDTSGETPTPIPGPQPEPEKWPWPEQCPSLVDPTKKNVRVYDDIKALGSIVVKKEDAGETITYYRYTKS